MTTAVRDEWRVEELRSFAVLDTPAEPGFDDLTELAAHLCQAPIALVSLVEVDRQWFKSAVGLGVPGTAIEDSFCRYALDDTNLSDAGLLEVPDATADERFAANPLVTGPEHVRFYAGAPLTTASGSTLGTLCVLDTRPRELLPQQRLHLLLLARQVLAQLEMRRYARVVSERNLEQARARAALERNQRLLDGVLAASQAVIYAKDTDGRFLLANPALHQLLGRVEGSLPGMTNWDVFPALAADQFHRNDRDVAASGTASSFTELLTHPDGEVHEYLTTKFPLHTEDGAVYAVGGVSTDVTALAEHRRQLAESLNRWRALVERSPVPVAVIAADGTFAYANPPAQALYEQAVAGDVTGRAAEDYCPPGAEEASRELFHRVLQGATAAGQPWQLRGRDGSVIDVEINAVAIEYDGAPAVQVELRDVSARAAADAALRASEARWRAVFDASPVGIGLADEHGRFIAANAALCMLLGRVDSDIIGHSSAEFTHPEDLASHRATSTLIAGAPNGFVRIEKRYLRPDGTARWAWLTVTHTPGPDGQVWTLAHVQDVTDRIAAEQAVRDSEANLTAVAAVVHDIQAGADARHTIVHAGLAMAEAAVVCLLEPTADRAELRVTASTLQRLTGISVPATGGSATADVYASGQPLFVADVTGRPGGSPAMTQLTDARSLYLVPVRTGTDTHAVLLVAWSRVIDTLEDRRVAGATLLSDQAGVALRQASLLNELSDLAMTDSLTGLPNRRAWDQRLDRLLTRARRTGHPLTVALADLDHFKRFNDTYGHIDGDALLTQFAAAATRKLRDDDTLARWGGEEFAIALPECAADDAPTVLNKLRAVMPRAQTVSIGFATFDGTETAAELIARADRALYCAKANGRNQVCTLPELPADTTNHAVIERAGDGRR